VKHANKKLANQLTEIVSDKEVLDEEESFIDAKVASKASMQGGCWLTALRLYVAFDWLFAMNVSHIYDGESEPVENENRAREQTGRRLRRPYLGREVMEWFSKKTSIAGVEIPNWGVALAAVVVILILYSYMR
jgi:hypothetical protein